MRLCFPELKEGRDWRVSKQDWVVRFPNGSEIWFGGLDNKERTEKILGLEYCTIYLNEISQIPFSGFEIVKTRLAQVAVQEVVNDDGQTVAEALINRFYFDCNPPSKAHWCYKMFVKKEDPISRSPLPKKGRDYEFLYMNPKDNEANLPPDYIEDILSTLSGPKRLRFLEGKFTEELDNALWTDDIIDKYRIKPGGHVPAFKKVVVAIDPSGADDEENAHNDEIGIVVAGLGDNNHGYIIEDVTIKAGPATWGRVATNAYDRHFADRIVGEKNYGGAMVEYVVKTQKKNVKYVGVTASRGKAVRAEPVSALYENGLIHHIGYFPELEEEQCSFTDRGFMGEGSPNRADAMVWAITDLFPEIAGTKKIAGAIR